MKLTVLQLQLMNQQFVLLIKKWLNNPADRDHCLQYITTIGLLKGDIVADDYEDAVTNDPCR